MCLRCWRMSGSFVASSVMSTMSHIHKAGLTSHVSWRCGVGSHADSSRCPHVFEHDESCSYLADSGCDVSVCASLLVNHASQVDKRVHLPDGLSTNCDWCVGSCVHLRQLSLLSVDLEPCPCWCGLRESGIVLHLAVIVWQGRQVIGEVEVI